MSHSQLSAEAGPPTLVGFLARISFKIPHRYLLSNKLIKMSNQSLLQRMLPTAQRQLEKMMAEQKERLWGPKDVIRARIRRHPKSGEEVRWTMSRSHASLRPYSSIPSMSIIIAASHGGKAGCESREPLQPLAEGLCPGEDYARDASRGREQRRARQVPTQDTRAIAGRQELLKQTTFQDPSGQGSIRRTIYYLDHPWRRAL